MANASSVIKMLQGNYQLVGLNADDTFKKTDMLLKLYRKVCWSMGEYPAKKGLTLTYLYNCREILLI